MKRPHLLRVEEGPERCAPLLSALAAAGLRAGWLELAAPAALPADLEAAAAAGVLRAVAVGGGRTVAVKPLKGEPVLADLLREHFLGCALVLVRGEVEAPLLRPESATPEAGRWVVQAPGRAARAYGEEALVAALRKPRPWGDES